MPVRTTVVLDEFIVERVRQLFNGNLSRGLNELLREHFRESGKQASGFGLLKGKVSVKDLVEFEREEEEELRA